MLLKSAFTKSSALRGWSKCSFLKWQRRLLHHQLRVSNTFPMMIQHDIDPNKNHPPNSSDHSSDAIVDDCQSQRLMLLNRLLIGGAAGTFYLLPHTMRAFEKLCRLLDAEMKGIGGQKIAMPMLSGKELWKRSNRWELMGSELFTLKDRHDRGHCLSPTHEEAVTSMLAASQPIVKKALPIKLYQIGRKFRDEMRPKNGLLRSREFEMKDLYTFDMDETAAEVTYNEVCAAYERFLKLLELDHVKVDASAALMKGNRSHEFQLLAIRGEDTIFKCDSCGRAINKEMLDTGEVSQSSCELTDCPDEFQQYAAIEVAHAFMIGTRYSEIFQANYLDEYGKKRPLYMGCFGVGMTRLLAAAIEVLSSNDQIRWPRLIAPHQICVVPQMGGFKADVTLNLADELCMTLNSLPALTSEVILDDRLQLSIGRRVKLAKEIGFPHIIILGKKALEDPPVYEYVDVYSNTTHFYTEQQLLSHVNNIQTVIL